jgi:methionyl aminopeptidase
VIHLKTLYEIKQIEYANKMVAEILQMCYEHIKPGVATIELEEIAEKYCIDHNVKPSFKGYKGFPYCLCVSLNEEVVHGFPGARKIVDGDIVSVDCGVNRNGYYGDAAFTKIVGEVPPRIETLVKTTENCLYEGIKSAVPKGRLYDISKAVQSMAEKKGFGVVRSFTGHGVGFAVHEKPMVPNYVTRGINYILKTGLVIAIEPMLVEGDYEVEIASNGWVTMTKDRKMAAHFEHTIAIMEDGPRILSVL